MTTDKDENLLPGLIKESGLTLSVCLNGQTPRKTGLYYDKELKIKRLLIINILAEYIRSGRSLLKPVKCLDAYSGAGINGLLWKKYISDGDIDVCIATQHYQAVDTITENAKRNDLKVDIINKDICVLLYEEPFNFIHIDCHTSASHYFDAAFRNLPRNGILIITTKDDCSLQGRNPNAALRNYGGYIAKTSYSTELGIRLVIAALTRSAAKYSKAVEVICCAAFKNSFMIAVTVVKGAVKTDKALENIRRLAHCTVCGKWQFYPKCNEGNIKPYTELVKCACCSKVEIDVDIIRELGPVWYGEIFDSSFLKLMLLLDKGPSKELVNSFIQQLLAETMEISCESGTPNLEASEFPPKKKLKCSSETNDNIDTIRNDENMPIDCQSDHIKNQNVKPDYQQDGLEKPTTPHFYYNLPVYTPRIPRQVPIDKVISELCKKGFKASRTHFDREAVRTSANMEQLIDVIKALS